MIGLFLLPVLLPSIAGASSGTYFIRPDGGDALQCTGLADAPYPGSGTGLDCAWSHPFWALEAGEPSTWRISGGDTLIIHSGSYMMGYGAPNTGWCSQEGAFDCHLPPLPSGPDPEHPTRILGSGWKQGCGNPPELWGTQRPWQIISLDGSSNVEIRCLEITDHSSCVEFHTNSEVECDRDAYPFGDWAGYGIYAADSDNVLLKDLNIHGLANGGVQAGRISDWKTENVRIATNGWVGWDGDIGISESTGSLIFRNFTVEWNGCGEKYPEKTAYGCWAQSAGGYGDGMGLNTTGGNWLIEDSIFRYNTSDGLDMLYVRLVPSNIRIRRTQSYGNAGDQIKVNGPAQIENSLIVSNCGFFDGKSFTYNVDNCRAGGSAISLNMRRGNQASVINSTIAGEGDCLILTECDVLSGNCDGSEKVDIQNNIFLGYPDFGDPGDQPAYLYFHPNVFGTVNTGYNLVHGAKISNIGLTASDLQMDPLLVNADMEHFNGYLQPGSPAIDSGLPVDSLGGLVPDHDLENNPRPIGAGVDRGSYEGNIYEDDRKIANTIFNWLESLFPSILSPATQPTQVINSIYFRFYPDTNVYTATFQNDLYFFDHSGVLHNLGSVDIWLPYAIGN